MREDLHIEDKTASALRYLIQAASFPPETLVEMLYLADLAHLHRWGRLITRPQYVAVRQGIRLAIAPDLEQMQWATLDQLSVSDTMVLDELVVFARQNGPTSVTRRAKDACWLRLRKAAPSEAPVPVSLEDMARLSLDAEPLLAHLRDSHPGEAISRA